MAMAMTPILAQNPIMFSITTTTITTTASTKHVITNHSYPSLSFQNKSGNDRRELLLPRVASTPYQPINVDYLEQQFSGHGVTFKELGDTFVAKLALDNGSVAILMLPSGLVVSYKAAMWHGGTDEMLHSFVSEDSDGNLVNGGVSVELEFGTVDGVSWSPSNWALHNITGSPQDSIQVELICTNSMDKVEIKYIVSLKEQELSSELVISNSTSSAIQMTGCVFLSHLRVSSPEATFAIGLEGSDFYIRPPFMSNFGVVPPEFGKIRGSPLSQLMKEIPFWDKTNQSDVRGTLRELKEELEGEEDENYMNLGEEMSLFYTSAPRNVSVIDRGRRNSVIVGRKGSEEMYMFSPGSNYEMYGKYSYVCVGQSAMLKPITAAPDQELHLGLDLYNPNL